VSHRVDAALREGMTAEWNGGAFHWRPNYSGISGEIKRFAKTAFLTRQGGRKEFLTTDEHRSEIELEATKQRRK